MAFLLNAKFTVGYHWNNTTGSKRCTGATCYRGISDTFPDGHLLLAIADIEQKNC